MRRSPQWCCGGRTLTPHGLVGLANSRTCHQHQAIGVCMCPTRTQQQHHHLQQQQQRNSFNACVLDMGHLIWSHASTPETDRPTFSGPKNSSHQAQIHSHPPPDMECANEFAIPAVSPAVSSHFWQSVLIHGCQFSLLAVSSQFWLSVRISGCQFAILAVSSQFWL